MNPNEIDLDVVLAGSKMNIDSTTNSYNTYLNHLRKFLQLDKKQVIGKEHLTDELIAKFIYYLMTTMQHKPHHLKSASAALGAELQRVGGLGIYDNRVHYPYTINMMKKWRVHNKIHPYHVEQSEGHSIAAVAEMLQLVRNTHLWLRDLAIVIVTNFTGLRMQDVERLCERNIKKMQPGPNGAPRRWELSMEVAKNNRSGAGMTDTESVVMVPCICHLEMTAPETKKWTAKCAANPNHPCSPACPFAIMCEYQMSKPTAPIHKNSPPLAPCDLAFARAVSAQGGALRTLTAGKVGINELRRMPERVNLRLPEDLRTSTPAKGHSGRHGLCTNAVNSGVSFDKVSLVSKHQRADQLAHYVKADAKAMCEAALGIGGAIVQVARAKIAGEREEEEGAGGEDEVVEEGNKENAPLSPGGQGEPASPATPVTQKSLKRAGTPRGAPASKRQATPAGKSKVVRAGTPLRRAVHWDPEIKATSEEEEEEEKDIQDSPTTAAQLRAATEGNTNCISHADMRRACVRSRGEGGSSSGVKSAALYRVNADMEEEGDEEEDDEEESGSKRIHIHLHMGGVKKKRG